MNYLISCSTCWLSFIHYYPIITHLLTQSVVFPPDGLLVYWDGVKKVKIRLPPSLHGQVCGMCGPIEDFTGDMLVGPHDINQQSGTTCPAKAAGLPMHNIVSNT